MSSKCNIQDGFRAFPTPTLRHTLQHAASRCFHPSTLVRGFQVITMKKTFVFAAVALLAGAAQAQVSVYGGST